MNLLSAAFDLPEPIRPRHCPVTNPAVTDKHSGHLACDGVGFLYPDPPDWWGGPNGRDMMPCPDSRGWYTVTWAEFCQTAYRVLGVVENTDA